MLVAQSTRYTQGQELFLITNNSQKNYANQSLELKRKVYLSLKDNIWVADLANLQLISKYNKEI